MTHIDLSPEQEAEAQQLEAKIRRDIEQEVAQLARVMVSKSERDLFGQTEFQIRDLVLRIGAKAYEEHLREKKRLPRLGRKLSDLWTGGGVSRLPIEDAAEYLGADPVSPRLLLLPSLLPSASWANSPS